MTNEEAILHMKIRRDELINSVGNGLDEDIKAFDMAIKALELQPKWIPITVRHMTLDELMEYGLEEGYVCDCPLPEDGEDVIITTPFGVRSTTFYRDYGCYFEDYEDEGEVLAWMRLPEPYTEVENDE